MYKFIVGIAALCLMGVGCAQTTNPLESENSNVVAGAVDKGMLSENGDLATPSQEELAALADKMDPATRLVDKAPAEGGAIEIEIVQNMSEPTALNDVFSPKAGAHVTVAVSQTDYADASPTLLTGDFLVTSLPVKVYVVAAAKSFKEKGEYAISATVYNHSGNNLMVGDLSNEVRTPIKGSDTQITLLVSGLEKCGSKGGGGACVSK